MTCTWDAHHRVPPVSTGAHPQGMRCGIGWHAVLFQPFASSNGADRRRLSAAAAAKEPPRCVLLSPPVLISEPRPAWIMPVAGSFMRGRHALKPAWTGKRRRRTRTIAPACRGSPADRDSRPRASSRRDCPAWACNVPDSRTTHPPAPMQDLNVRRCQGIARPQPGGDSGRNCVVIARPAVRPGGSLARADLQPPFRSDSSCASISCGPRTREARFMQFARYADYAARVLVCPDLDPRPPTARRADPWQFRPCGALRPRV